MALLSPGALVRGLAGPATPLSVTTVGQGPIGDTAEKGRYTEKDGEREREVERCRGGREERENEREREGVKQGEGKGGRERVRRRLSEEKERKRERERSRERGRMWSSHLASQAGIAAKRSLLERLLN